MGMNEDQNNKQCIRTIAEGMVSFPGSYIFVIGAGASASVGIPTSSQLKEVLIQGWKKEIETKLAALEPKIRYDDPGKVPLEILLPIYAEIVKGEDAIEKFLKGQLDRFSSWETFPPLGYEILAHLTNNGLVRYIICMNFDELLDVALDEELGENNYEKVRNEPAFARLKDDIEESRGRAVNILEGKILFKPHGTLSFSATLRPTLDEVLNLKEDEREVLRHVLIGNNVIFIGYSFVDPDIQKLFLPLADERRLKEIYFVDKNKNLLKDNEKIGVLLSKGVPEKSAFIHMESDEFLQELASAIKKDKQGEFYPTITRHQIRNSIFNNEKLNCKPVLENRLLVELIIFALKVKGKFSTKALLTCERVKYYTTKLLEEKEKSISELPSPNSLLERLKGSGILKIETSKQERVYGIGEETCYLVKQNENIIEEIISALPKLLKIGVNNLQRVKSKLCDQMADLVKDFDYDLSPALHPLEFSFLSPDHKRDPIEHRQTLVAKEILDKGAEEEKPCYVIAETGEWLLKNSVSSSDKLNKVIRIIVSDFRNDPEDSLHRAISEDVYNRLEEKFGPDKIGLLNWHLNKHHGTFSSKRCIYFYKEGKSPTLQPVELTDPSDTERMMKLCEYLWQQCNFLIKGRGQNPKRC